jgi:hypothetical protein
MDLPIYKKKEQTMLKYDEFINKVNEYGFWTPYTNYFDQKIFTFHSQDILPRIGQCYIGDPDTDPEVWKTRVVKEKKLACGHFLTENREATLRRVFIRFLWMLSNPA